MRHVFNIYIGMNLLDSPTCYGRGKYIIAFIFGLVPTAYKDLPLPGGLTRFPPNPDLLQVPKERQTIAEDGSPE